MFTCLRVYMFCLCDNCSELNLAKTLLLPKYFYNIDSGVVYGVEGNLFTFPAVKTRETYITLVWFKKEISG